MAAVDRGGSAAAPEPPANPARLGEAAKLLDMFTAAKPINPDAFVPEVGMPGGGDIQLQPVSTRTRWSGLMCGQRSLSRSWASIAVTLPGSPTSRVRIGDC